MSISKLLFYVCSIVLIGIYYGLVLRYSTNIPNADDYDMLLSAAISFIEADSLVEYAKVMFRKHGEHIVFTSRSLAVLSALILGSVHFGLIILIGNLSLIVVFYLLVKESRLRGPDRFIYLLPVPFFLFQPQFVESTLWAAGASQHLIVMVPVLLCFSLAAGKVSTSKGILACFCFSTFALLTQGNGIFALPIATILLIKRGEKYWSIFFLMVSIFQFLLFSESANNLKFEPFFNYVAYSLGFLGSTLAGNFYSAALNSIALIIIFMMTYKKMFSEQPVIFAMIVFLGLTALSNSLVRIQFGIDAGYQLSRYHYPAALFLIGIWLGAVKLGFSVRAKKYLSITVTFFAVLFWFNAYREYLPQFELRNNLLSESVAKFQATSAGLSYPDQKRATEIYYKADRMGLYSLPEIDLAKVYSDAIEEELNPTRANIIQHMETALVGPQYVVFGGYSFFPNKKQKFNQVIIRLKSVERSLSLYTDNRTRPDVARHHFLGNYLDTGYFGVFSRENIPEGDYKIFIVLRNSSGDYFVDTGKRLVLLDGVSV